jgi:F-type H+-transporting ATPase subunit b
VEFFNQFGVDLPKLIFQVINFLILLYLLNRFLFKPVLRLLDEREARIRKGLEDAEAAARDRHLAEAEREASMSEARKEAQSMLARANKIAEDTRSEILGDARSEAGKLVERAREEITAEKERAMAELRTHVANLALDAAGKLVRSEMSGDTQRRLVEEFLTEVDAGDGKATKN